MGDEEVLEEGVPTSEEGVKPEAEAKPGAEAAEDTQGEPTPLE